VCTIALPPATFYDFLSFFFFVFFSCYYFPHPDNHDDDDNNNSGLNAVTAENKDDDDKLPKLLVFGIALVGLGLLIANTALVAWFIIRKRIKGKKQRVRTTIARVANDFISFSCYSIVKCSTFMFDYDFHSFIRFF